MQAAESAISATLSGDLTADNVERWADGIPVVVPTEERVARMLAATTLDPDHVIGFMPPKGGQATVRKIAANAVMAGCTPDQFPVVIAAVQGVLRPEFNLFTVQNLSHVTTIVIVVQGPIRSKIGLHTGPNLFGTGVRANTNLSQALGFVLLNLGWGPPQPGYHRWGKAIICIGEDEEGSPWPPFAASRGVPANAPGSVTVFPGESARTVTNFAGKKPEDVLETFVDTLLSAGNAGTGLPGEALLVLSSEHAHVIGGGGMSRADVQHEIFERTRKSRDFLRSGGLYGDRFDRYDILKRPDGSLASDFPIVTSPSGVLVVVAGGRAGKFSAVVPAWGYAHARSVTVALT